MQTYRILFIGNSHTYLHYMPQLLSALAETVGKNVHVDQVTGEGTSLQGHWSRQATRTKIANGEWTHVVLQERSRGPLEDKASMQLHARRLNAIICSANSRTVFYMTWAARERWDEQGTISAAYKEVAVECRAMLAPVGQAWELIRRRYPAMVLHHKDGRHANKAGAYLNACVFYALLLESAPAGLAGTVEINARVLVKLRDEEAQRLQKAAHDAVVKLGVRLS